MNRRFTGGSQPPYEELPVKAAYLRWTRGDAKLRAVYKEDPTLYLGGWRATYKAKDGTELPPLPWPLVTRATSNGKGSFQLYAHPVCSILPINHRTRFELRTKVKDPTTGQANWVIAAVSKAKVAGYTPVRQIFGWVYGKGDPKKGFPAVMVIGNWSAFISFERADGKWNKIANTLPEDEALIRRYGTLGYRDKESGILLPCIEERGDIRSTPIEAVGLDTPLPVKITPELDSLWKASMAWANCPRWNAEAAAVPVHENGNEEAPVEDKEAMNKFFVRCRQLGLSNIDQDDLLAQAHGDYAKALALCEEGTPKAAGEDLPTDAHLDDLNAEIEGTEEVAY